MNKYFHIGLLLLGIVFSNKIYAQNSALSKRLSFEFIDVPPSLVLSHINNATGIQFAYVDAKIDLDQKINYQAKDQRADSIIYQFCRKFELDIKYLHEVFLIKPSNQLLKKYKSGQLHHPLFVVDGFIKEAGTGESVIGATIYIPELETGAITNAYGYFSLTLPKGTHKLLIRSLGYSTNIQEIELTQNTHLNSFMNPEFTALSTIVVTGSQSFIDGNLGAPKTLQTMDMLPSPLGENEIIKSLDNITGVTSQGEGSVFFHVRGGDKDQNLILLDEAPIYNPAHLLGFFTSFAPNTVQDVKMHKSAIPIELGGRLSSIMEVRTKDGDLYKWGAFASLTPFTSTVSIQGPTHKERNAMYLSFRKSNLRKFVLNEYNVKAYFYDVNFKDHFVINDNNKLFVSFYSGIDYYAEPNDFNDHFIKQKDLFYNTKNTNYFDTYTAAGQRSGMTAGWLNRALSFRWNHIYNDKLFSNTSLYFSRFDYRLKVGDNSLAQVAIWNENIRNGSLKHNFTYYKSPKVKQTFGYLANVHEIDPGNFYGNNILRFPTLQKQMAQQVILYWGNQKKLNNDYTLEYGIRLNNWLNVSPERNQYQEYELRGNLKKALDSTTLFKIAYDESVQFINLLNNSSSPLTNLDYWVPADANIKPQKAHQISTGIQKYFKDKTFYLELETYARSLKNQIDFIDHPQLMLNPDFHTQLRSGYGYAYGTELTFEKLIGQFRMHSSYHYSRTYRVIDGINNGNIYSPYFDRPHDFNLALNYISLGNFDLAANWMISSGARFTAPTSTYLYNGVEIPVYSSKNNDRLPSYQRLDLSATYHLPSRDKNKLEHFIKVSIINAYDRENAIAINYNFTKENNTFLVPFNTLRDNQFIQTQAFVLGIMGAINYTIKIN